MDLTRSVLLSTSQGGETVRLWELWQESLESVLDLHGTVALEDPEALSALREDLSQLPFVAGVGAVRGRWPASLEVDLELHEPIACVRVGDLFLPLATSASGTGRVLPGASPEPHVDAAGGWLPVVLPCPDRWQDEPPAPGTWLHPERIPERHLVSSAGDPESSLASSELRPEHVRAIGVEGSRHEGFCAALLEALSVAASWRAQNSSVQRARYGRMVIDCSAETAFDGRHGGVVCLLDGERVLHFGHSPRALDPELQPLSIQRARAELRAAGELPLALKWGHAREAFDLLRTQPWTDADLRFDSLEVWGDPAASDEEERPR